MDTFLDSHPLHLLLSLGINIKKLDTVFTTSRLYEYYITTLNGYLSPVSMYIQVKYIPSTLEKYMTSSFKK